MAPVAPCSKSPGSGISPVAVSARLTKLSPSTTYHFRIAAVTEGETFSGGDQSFTTAAAGPQAPSVLTEAATGVGTTAATLNAKVDPNGQQVTACVLEYGTSRSLGSSAAANPNPARALSYVSVSATVTGLAEATTYYYRVSASNAIGTAHGEVERIVHDARSASDRGAPSRLRSVTDRSDAERDGQPAPASRSSNARSNTVARPPTKRPSRARRLPGEGHSAVARVGRDLGTAARARRITSGCVARNPHGTSTSADASFVTVAEPPVAVTESALAVGSGSATLTGARRARTARPSPPAASNTGPPRRASSKPRCRARRYRQTPKKARPCRPSSAGSPPQRPTTTGS